MITAIGHLYRPSDRVRKKMENYVEIFGNNMWTKVMIMQKFVKLIKLFPWLFFNVQNILPRILVLYDLWPSQLPFMDRYFFVQCSFSLVLFVQSLVTRHEIGRGKLDTRSPKLEPRPIKDAWNAWRFRLIAHVYEQKGMFFVAVLGEKLL